MCCLQVTEVSQRNSGGSSQANGTSSSPSSGVSSQVTSTNGSTAATTSVKAALAAIQAGQLSLNQVPLWGMRSARNGNLEMPVYFYAEICNK